MNMPSSTDLLSTSIHPEPDWASWPAKASSVRGAHVSTPCSSTVMASTVANIVSFAVILNVLPFRELIPYTKHVTHAELHAGLFDAP